MFRFSFAMCLLVAGVALSAAPVPTTPPDPTKDRDGNPLPKGATARLGSLAFRGPTMATITFSADGKKLRACAGLNLFSWDANTGRSLPTKALAPSKKETSADSILVGDRLFLIEWQRPVPGKGRLTSTGTVSVMDIDTGKELSRIPCNGSINFAPNYYPPRHASAEVSRDGRYLALVSAVDRAVEMYDTDTGKRLHTQSIDPYHGGTVISPDGKTLYIFDATRPIRRCELVSGKALQDLDGTNKSTDYLAVSSDGKRVVTRGSYPEKDERGNVVSVAREPFLMVRDAVENKTLGKLDVGAVPEHFAFVGPDSVIAFVAKYRSQFPPVMTLERWNVKSFQREWQVSVPPLRFPNQWLTVSPDGKRVAITDRQCIALVYDATTGKLVVEPTSHTFAVAWIGFTHNGEQILTAAEDGIRTWTLKGEPKSTQAPPELARKRFEAALGGEHLVWTSHSEDWKKTEVVGWDQERGAIGWRMPLEGTPRLVLSSDGKRCVGLDLNNAKREWEVTIFNGSTGKTLFTWTLPITFIGPGLPVALSPGGDMVFVAGDGIVGLDATNGKEKVRIAGGPFRGDGSGGAFPMVVSADGTRLAVITRYEQTGEQGLLVYEIKTGKKLAEYNLGHGRSALRFSPNGKQVALWNGGGSTVLLCDAESSQGQPRKLEGGTYRATAAAFSPNGGSLAVGYQDGTALVWDLSAK